MPATHPIVVRTKPGRGRRGCSSVPVKIRIPPPTRLPNQKTRPPSPLRTSRTVSAIPAATSKPPSDTPSHQVQPRIRPRYPLRPPDSGLDQFGRVPGQIQHGDSEDGGQTEPSRPAQRGMAEHDSAGPGTAQALAGNPARRDHEQQRGGRANPQDQRGGRERQRRPLPPPTRAEGAFGKNSEQDRVYAGYCDEQPDREPGRLEQPKVDPSGCTISAPITTAGPAPIHRIWNQRGPIRRPRNRT